METALKILTTLGDKLIKEEEDCPRRAITGIVQDTIKIITNSPEDRLERLEKLISALERVVRVKISTDTQRDPPRTYTNVACYLPN
jgi:hypothetical protein